MSRKRHPVWRILFIMATDLIAIGAALYGTYWVRFYSTLLPVRYGFLPSDYTKILPYAWGIWFLSLRLENLYRRRSRALDFNVVRRIVTGSCLALLALIALNFFFKIGEYSRPLAVILLVMVIAALNLNRLLLHFFFQWMMIRHGVGQSRAIVLGNGPLAEHVCRTIEQHPESGMRVVGVILDRSQPDKTHGAPHFPPGVPVLGTTQHLDALLVEHRADQVILAQPGLERELIPALLVQCERAMTEFLIVPETTELLLSGMTAEMLDGIPLLGIRETPLQGWNAALKRMIDFSAALVGLLLTSWLIALLAWLVRRQDGAPAFYMQERMGIDGRLFRIIKLRTMRPDAEVDGPAFASELDPRCTALGHLLRRLHLDELPQLVNVLRGEMSLIGPRPERPYFVGQFRDNVPRYMARHKVKSGITGWAQVNGLCGPHGSIDERLKFDLYYIENWSLGLDLKILVMTLFGHVKPGQAQG